MSAFSPITRDYGICLNITLFLRCHPSSTCQHTGFARGFRAKWKQTTVSLKIPHGKATYVLSEAITIVVIIIIILAGSRTQLNSDFSHGHVTDCLIISPPDNTLDHLSCHDTRQIVKPVGVDGSSSLDPGKHLQASKRNPCLAMLAAEASGKTSNNWFMFVVKKRTIIHWQGEFS